MKITEKLLEVFIEQANDDIVSKVQAQRDAIEGLDGGGCITDFEREVYKLQINQLQGRIDAYNGLLLMLRRDGNYGE